MSQIEKLMSVNLQDVSLLSFINRSIIARLHSVDESGNTGYLAIINCGSVVRIPFKLLGLLSALGLADRLVKWCTQSVASDYCLSIEEKLQYHPRLIWVEFTDKIDSEGRYVCRLFGNDDDRDQCFNDIEQESITRIEFTKELFQNHLC